VTVAARGAAPLSCSVDTTLLILSLIHVSRYVVYKRKALKGRAFNNVAAAFVGLAIEEFVPSSYDRKCIQKCLSLANDTSQVSLQRLGIDKNQVLTKVAGILIILLDLEEAVFRADLFTNTQHMALRELASRERASAAARAKSSLKPSPSTKAAPVTPAKSSSKLASPVKKKRSSLHCMNGAQCRNILNGECRFHHTPHEIALAGAIIEELIGVSCCKVGWIIGTNGENIARIRESSNADLWIEDTVLQGNIRMLHVLGSRKAVEKGIEQVMKIAARCEEGAGVVKSETAEALVGISPSKCKILVGSEALEKMIESSGATIVVGESRCCLRVVGTKEAVDKAIHLLIEWGAQGDGNGKADSLQTSIHTSELASTGTSVTMPNDTQTESVPPAAAPLVPSVSFPTATAVPSVPSACAPTDPQTSLNDDEAWPSLASSDTIPQRGRVPAKPMIQPTKKAVKKSSTAPSKGKAKKKDAMCIHGAGCQYIRNGRDECEYYHSAKDLEQSVARHADRNVEHAMYMSRKAVSYIIGKKGNVVKEIMRESGAKVANDPVKKGNDENRVVSITGTQKSVDAAIEMITERLPEYIVEPGPRESTSTVELVSKDSSKPTTATPPADASTSVRVPSPTDSSQPTNLVSPPQLIRELQQVAEQSALLSSNASVSTGSGSSVSEAARNSGTSTSLAVVAYGCREVQNIDPAFMGDMISTMAAHHPAPGMMQRNAAVSTGELIPLMTPTAPHYPAPGMTQNNAAVVTLEPVPRVAPLIPDLPTPPGIMPLQQRMSQHHVAQDIAKPTFETSLPSTPTKTLLEVLSEQKGSLKGSPEAFCEWLLTEDIHNLKDLGEAVADEEYLREVLQQGDGTVGVKGFKRSAFKKAIMDASQDAYNATGTGMEAIGAHSEPLTELVCPISHVLMTNDPVIAADGHTYERAAIEEWFEKQTTQVIEAKQQMATVGADSQRARGIIERGVLSPMTHSQMLHLNLTPNHAVRTMARDAAASSPR